jgi:hypothetical protein
MQPDSVPTRILLDVYTVTEGLTNTRTNRRPASYWGPRRPSVVGDGPCADANNYWVRIDN